MSRNDSAARVIQRAARGFLTRRYLSFLANFFSRWTRTVQSHYRGRRTRFAFKCVHDLVSTAQSQIRGYLVRKALHNLRKERLSVYRKQICQLWRRTYTPLWYRTWFWSAINRYRFLHLALHEDELIRLWSELGLKPMEYGNNVSSGHSQCSGASDQSSFNGEEENMKYGRIEQMLGGKTMQVHKRFMIVQRKLDSISSSVNSGSGSKGESSSRVPIFPTETAVKNAAGASKNASVAKKAENMLAARKRLAKERDEIYTTLKNCKKTSRHGTLHRIYEAFRISETAKEKKRRVVDLLWEHRAYAKVSIEVVRLNEGTSDEFGKLSLHGTTGVTDIYQAKMREARNHLFFVQSASQWEVRGGSQEASAFKRQKRAVRQGLGGCSWFDCRSVVIARYISCGDPHYEHAYLRVALERMAQAGRFDGRSFGSGSRNSAERKHRRRRQSENLSVGSEERSKMSEKQKNRRNKKGHMPVPMVIGVDSSPTNTTNTTSSSSGAEKGHGEDQYGNSRHSGDGYGSHPINDPYYGHEPEIDRSRRNPAYDEPHENGDGEAHVHTENLRKYWERIDSMKVKPRREQSLQSIDSRQSSVNTSTRDQDRKGKKKGAKHLDDLEEAFGF